jgi:hypothetical protein
LGRCGLAEKILDIRFRWEALGIEPIESQPFDHNAEAIVLSRVGSQRGLVLPICLNETCAHRSEKAGAGRP